MNLYSVAYKALQRITRWAQENQNYKGELKGSRNKKTHQHTKRERKVTLGKPRDSCLTSRSTARQQTHLDPSREEHDKTAGGIDQNREHHRCNRQPRSTKSKPGHHAVDGA
jgi:hypothetical protein